MKNEISFPDRLRAATLICLALFRYLLSSNGMQLFVMLDMRRGFTPPENRAQIEEFLQGVYDWFCNGCRNSKTMTQAYVDGQNHARFLYGDRLNKTRDEERMALATDFFKEHTGVDGGGDTRFNLHRRFVKELNDSGFAAVWLDRAGSAYRYSKDNVTVQVSDCDNATDFFNVGHDLIADRRDDFGDVTAIVSVYVDGIELPNLRCKVTADAEGSLTEAVVLASHFAQHQPSMLKSMSKRT